MQTALVIAVSLHVLSSVFWAGSSFALARTGGAGGEQLVFPQLGAATIAILTGAYLGHLVHAGSFGTPEQVLALGAVCALIAVGVQAAIGPARSAPCAAARAIQRPCVHALRPHSAWRRRCSASQRSAWAPRATSESER